MLHFDAISAEFLEYSQRWLEGAEKIADLASIDVEPTPYETVWRQDKLTLRRYVPDVANSNLAPMLIVYALVNRPSMLDLQADRSFIAGLLAQGQTVYLIDWGYPERADRYLELDDYIHGYLNDCVDKVCQLEHDKPINLLGVCQGGTFSLCYAALYPEKVNHLTLLVTPVDFQTADNMLSHWVQTLDVDLLVDTVGLVPGEMLNTLFTSLKPFQLMGQKYVNLVDMFDQPQKLENFMRMEKWINDSPDQAGEAFRQFAKDCYQHNKLMKNTLEIGEETVDLKKIKIPILNIFASHDHLVPPAASKALSGLTSSCEYQEMEVQAGHIGIFTGHKSQALPAMIVQSLLNTPI